MFFFFVLIWGSHSAIHGVTQKLLDDVSIQISKAGSLKEKMQLVDRHIVNMIWTDVQKLANFYGRKTGIDTSEIESIVGSSLSSIVFRALEKKVNADNLYSYISGSIRRIASRIMFNERTSGMNSVEKKLYRYWLKIKKLHPQESLRSLAVKELLSQHYVYGLDGMCNTLEHLGLRPMTQAEEIKRQSRFETHYASFISAMEKTKISLNFKVDSGSRQGKELIDMIDSDNLLIDGVFEKYTSRSYWDCFSNDQKSRILDFKYTETRLRHIRVLIAADAANNLGYPPSEGVCLLMGDMNLDAVELIRTAYSAVNELLEKNAPFANEDWNSLSWRQKLYVIQNCKPESLKQFQNGIKGIEYNTIKALIVDSTGNDTSISIQLEMREKFEKKFWDRFTESEKKEILRRSRSNATAEILMAADRGIQEKTTGKMGVVLYYLKVPVDKASLEKAGKILTSAMKYALLIMAKPLVVKPQFWKAFSIEQQALIEEHSRGNTVDVLKAADLGIENGSSGKAGVAAYHLHRSDADALKEGEKLIKTAKKTAQSILGRHIHNRQLEHPEKKFWNSFSTDQQALIEEHSRGYTVDVLKAAELGIDNGISGKGGVAKYYLNRSDANSLKEAEYILKRAMENAKIILGRHAPL